MPVPHRNYLIEGVSGSGKTTVATQLERRGFHVVHGDRVLATRRAITRELHRTGRDQPDGIPIDATRPLAEVVEDILARCGLMGG